MEFGHYDFHRKIHVAQVNFNGDSTIRINLAGIIVQTHHQLTSIYLPGREFPFSQEFATDNIPQAIDLFSSLGHRQLTQRMDAFHNIFVKVPSRYKMLCGKEPN